MKKYTSNELIKIASDELKTANIDNPVFEAEILLSHLTNIPKDEFLIKTFTINDEISSEFIKLIQKRKTHYPLQYILGEWEFWSCKILLTEDVFIPRPETETIIQLCIENIPPDLYHFIDIGTGSGNIAIALAKEFPTAKIIAVDISYNALCIASKNILINNIDSRIKLVQSNLLDAINLNCIRPPLAVVSNPPYISEKEIDSLPDEVKIYEPRISYFANNNGLEYYFNIIEQLNKSKLHPIYLFFEITPLLANEIIDFAEKNNFIFMKIKKDLSNNERALFLKKIKS
jgi:release factor glutamine methyltransferase